MYAKMARALALALVLLPQHAASLRPTTAAVPRLRRIHHLEAQQRRPATLMAHSNSAALRASKAPTAAAEASPASTILSILKSIVGAGIFSLSAGLATGPGLLPSCLMLLLLGSTSAYTFYIVGRAAAETGCTTNKQLWERLVDERTGWIYDVIVGVLCLGGLVQFMGTMANLVQFIGPWLAQLTFPAPPDMSASVFTRAAYGALAHSSYEAQLLFLTALAMPLCLARNLHALRHASAVGAIGVLYAAVLLVVRAVDGSYRLGGAFESTPAIAGTNVIGIQLGGLPSFLGSLTTAFIAHLNIPRFYNELRAPASEGGVTAISPGTAARASAPAASAASAASRTPPKVRLFGRVVATSFGLAMLSTAIVMASGYVIFGDACTGFVLNNFAVTDHGAALLRVATLLSVLGVHPLTFLGLRDACAPLLVQRLKLFSETGLRLTLCALVLFLSLTFRNIARIVAVRGAFLGTLVTMVLPVIIYLKSERGQQEGPVSRGVHHALVGYGAIMAVVGTVCVLRT